MLGPLFLYKVAKRGKGVEVLEISKKTSLLTHVNGEDDYLHILLRKWKQLGIV